MTETQPDSGVAPAAVMPSTVGGYRVLKILGGGSFGVVYLAEDPRLERLVALKVLRSSERMREIQGVFRAEQAALSLMNSDYIAKLYETGEVDGQSFFALEYVEGEWITQYCDARRLSLADRIAVFARLCAGVQHAHQRGVIHRDLKPSNVLVSEVDGVAVPKIIDFGTARGRDRLLYADQLPTMPGRVLGTFVYMSPEQARAESVDTRTDVHALGVMLYELLAGLLPIDPTELEGLGIRALERLQQPLVHPGARYQALLAADGARAQALAAARGLSGPQLHGMLIGDLDWIVGKATEEDPDKRYATPSALADDLQRYLLHLPVTARPPSRVYRTRKFVRRHLWPVSLALAVLLLLISVAVGASVALAESEARQRANASALFQAGEFASERGDFDTALDRYTRAEASGYPDRIGLAIRRVEAHDGARRYQDAMAILEQLVADPALGTRAAKVDLLRADLGVDRLRDPEQNLGYAKHALELAAATPGALDEADTAYARALLATGPSETISLLREARRANPRHRRVNDCYGVSLLLVGRFDEARDFAHALLDLYPLDPQALFFAICVAGIRNEPDTCTSLVARVRQEFGEGEATTARLIADTTLLKPWADEFLRDSAMGENAKPFLVLAQLYGRLMPLLARWADEEKEGPMSTGFVRMPPALVRGYEPLARAVRGEEGASFNVRRVLVAINEASANVEEATLPLLHAIGLFAVGRNEEGIATLRRAMSLRAGLVGRRPMLMLAILMGGGVLIESTRSSGKPEEPKKLPPETEALLRADLTAWVTEASELTGLTSDEYSALHSMAQQVRSDRLLEIIVRWQRSFPDDDRARLAYAEFLIAVGGKERALQIACPIAEKPDLPDWLRNWCAAVIRLARQ